MLFVLGAALALNIQVQAQPSQSRRRLPVVRDSIEDTTTTTNRRRRQGVRKAVTAEVLSTAFKDLTAKTTLLSARAARLGQDSALVAYDAMSYQRLSVGM